MGAIVSVIPIVLLFVLMLGLKVSSWKSAFATMGVTAILALFAAPALGILPDYVAGQPISAVVSWSVFDV